MITLLGGVKHIANIRQYCTLTPVLTASMVSLGVSLFSYITLLSYVRVIYVFFLMVASINYRAVDVFARLSG